MYVSVCVSRRLSDMFLSCTNTCFRCVLPFTQPCQEKSNWGRRLHMGQGSPKPNRPPPGVPSVLTWNSTRDSGLVVCLRIAPGCTYLVTWIGTKNKLYTRVFPLVWLVCRVFAYLRACASVCFYVCVCVCARVCVCVCVWHMYMCMCMCVRACMLGHVHVQP